MKTPIYTQALAMLAASAALLTIYVYATSKSVSSPVFSGLEHYYMAIRHPVEWYGKPEVYSVLAEGQDPYFDEAVKKCGTANADGTITRGEWVPVNLTDSVYYTELYLREGPFAVQYKGEYYGVEIGVKYPDGTWSHYDFHGPKKPLKSQVEALTLLGLASTGVFTVLCLYSFHRDRQKSQI